MNSSSAFELQSLMCAEKKGAENDKYKETGRGLPTLTSGSPYTHTHTHKHLTSG